MHARSMTLALTWGMLSLVPSRAADLPEQRLPIWGGTGGTAFSRSCGDGRVLAGLRYRSGLVIDAAGLLCRPVNANGTLGAETTVGTFVGGTGGTLYLARCLSNQVVGGARIYFGAVVDGLELSCYEWTPATRSMGSFQQHVRLGRTAASRVESERCFEEPQPVVTMRGRAGGVVDAIGFTCDEP